MVVIRMVNFLLHNAPVIDNKSGVKMIENYQTDMLSLVKESLVRVEGGKKRTLSKNCSQSLNIRRIAVLYDGMCSSCTKL